MAQEALARAKMPITSAQRGRTVLRRAAWRSWPPSADLDRALPGPRPDCQVSSRYGAVLITARLFVLDGWRVWAYGRWRTPGEGGSGVPRHACS